MSSPSFGTVQNYCSKLGPWFVRNPNIQRFVQSVALVIDGRLQGLAFGLKLGQPMRCDPSGLPNIGFDRQIKFYRAESELSKRIRCRQWKKLHRTRGCHQGELKHAQPYFLPDVPLIRIVHQNSNRATWHTLDANSVYSIHKAEPSNWNWDGQTMKWSRWWVILYPPARLITLPRYGENRRYGSFIYGGAKNDDVARDFVDLFNDWKASYSGLRGVIIATDPTSFDPTATAQTSAEGWTTLPVGNWGRMLDDNYRRTRLQSAIWVYDRSDL